MEELTTDFIPAREPASNRLLMALHGLGDSMEGYRDVPQWLQIPGLNYLLVNAPDPYYGGFSWFNFAGEYQPGIERSRRLLTKLLDSLREKYPSDQTVLFGFSQGCLMTMETGLRYPHKLAALVGVSGWVYDADALAKELSPVAKQQRILWTHGTRDTLLPIKDVRTRIETLKGAGLNIEWREYNKEHNFLPQEFALIREFVSKSFAS
ncbi:MAG TPA: alpha/beta fold hydrolase [Verrucomicrobiae bacterium]|nr:alpha/beta fold hydrolase [Verrucomicrobiae bacterium]